MKNKFFFYKKYIVLIFGVLLFLSGCKSAKLRALENSVSNVQPTMGREVRRSLQNDGSALGKPFYAEVIIVYESIGNYTEEDLFDEIVTILKKNNWQDMGSYFPDYFRASSPYGGYLVSASVSLYPDRDEVVLITKVDNSSYHILTSTPLPTPFPKATNSTPELMTSPTAITGRDGMILLYIPAGEFTMGNDYDKPIPDEKPIHTVYLDAFYIDQTEVTNEMYAKCVESHQCDPPKVSSPDHFNDPGYSNHPVVSVDWNMANAYCLWVGRRLPTEAEWEKAARGTDARTYPWGEGIDCDTANYQKSCVGGTSPVRSYEAGKSPYGAYDLAGNAVEWVNDWYGETYYQGSPSSNPLGPDSGKYRVKRGGAWNHFDFIARSSYRTWGNPSYSDSNYGFRCARSLP